MDFIKAKGRKLFFKDQEILLRGFGLGGWLLPEGYMWGFFTKCDRPRRIEALIKKLCGKNYSERFWNEYYNNYITERDFDFISKQGFNSIRIPINARHIKEHWSYLDKCIQLCEKYSLFVIIDMHAAPGGQTGRNIDDSEFDSPDLFLNDDNANLLISLWIEIAKRYKDNPSVAGYDLINEPLPGTWKNLFDKIVPLYYHITDAIRKVDQNHMIIWEGAHWASDFSIFDNLNKKDLPENLMLQFHKYWNAPDKESIEKFIIQANRLNVPLFAGETGENNLLWYTTLFPLLEELDISWNFWCFRKLINKNAVSYVKTPKRWKELLAYLDGGPKPENPAEIFDTFINSIKCSTYNLDVISALTRRPPVVIPAEAYSGYKINTCRRKSADFRLSDPVTLLFKNCHSGTPDFHQDSGEDRPESEIILASLQEKESLCYTIKAKSPFVLTVIGQGSGTFTVNNLSSQFSSKLQLPPTDKITIYCTGGEIAIEKLILKQSQLQTI